MHRRIAAVERRFRVDGGIEKNEECERELKYTLSATGILVDSYALGRKNKDEV